MNNQLEFDLVSPNLVEDTAASRLLKEAADLAAQSREKIRLAKLAGELHREDLVIAPQPNTELEELKILIGPVAWKKSRRRWQRRLKQDVRAFRKVLVVLRSLATR